MWWSIWPSMALITDAAKTLTLTPWGCKSSLTVSNVRPMLSQSEGPMTRSSPKLQIRLPNVPDVLVGRRGGYVVIEKDSRILRDPNDLQPTGGLNIHTDAKLRQIIYVVDGGIAESILALHPIAKLSAELDPVG